MKVDVLLDQDVLLQSSSNHNLLSEYLLKYIPQRLRSLGFLCYQSFSDQAYGLEEKY